MPQCGVGRKKAKRERKRPVEERAIIVQESTIKTRHEAMERTDGRRKIKPLGSRRRTRGSTGKSKGGAKRSAGKRTKRKIAFGAKTGRGENKVLSAKGESKGKKSGQKNVSVRKPAGGPYRRHGEQVPLWIVISWEKKSTERGKKQIRKTDREERGQTKRQPALVKRQGGAAAY